VIDEQQVALPPGSPARLQIAGQICEEQQIEAGSAKRDVRVTVIRGGASMNGYYYSEDALKAIAGLMENAQAYVDHTGVAHGQVRSVRDVVGFYRNAVFLPSDDGTPGERVEATLHILESAQWLWSMIVEAVEMGNPGLIGLSIDIYGTWQPLPGSRMKEGQALKEVTSVLALNSCDIVTRPSAGGAFQHILHSLASETSSPQILPQEGAFPMNEQANNLFTAEQEAINPQAKPERVQEQLPHELMAQETQAILEKMRLESAQLSLERRLLSSTLPDIVKAHIRENYQGRVFEMAALEHELEAQRQLLANLAEAGLIRDHNYEKPALGSQITEAEKVQAAFDRMFDLEIDTSRLGNIRGFTSIREAYARVTGDASVTGLSEQSRLGLIRVEEASPLVRITEADTTTASFSYLLGTSMNKRLLKDYQAWPAEWMKFCTIVPIRDFKQQTRVRLGAFGSLPTVAEDTPYTSVSLSDTAATYVPSKRGNLVTVSRETIINDDLHAIKQIPTKLAVAAAYTLAEFVYGFLSTNPTIFDSNPLFMTGAPHNNLGSSALSTAAMQTGVTAMREQTNMAGKRIGLRPRYLIVPPELEWTAMVVTKSAGVPGSNNNDINPMMGYVTPIVSPQLSSATQWFFAADPAVVDTIEVGFVGGQINPALFVQDLPLYGLNFLQDVVSFKCRHEYGSTIVDWRGFYRGI
jgi:phage major head subunit gpT-like protein